MDVIQNARQLGKAIQEDERYLKLKLASEQRDADKELQEMIEKFNSERAQLNLEMRKPERDSAKIEEMNTSLGGLYNVIFQNENMKNYAGARDEMNKMIGFVNQIITGAADGKNPFAIEFEDNCGGGCSSCSGCAS